MSEPVRISYRWSRENVEKLFAASYDYQFRHSSRRYIGWLFIALLQFGVVAALKKGFIGLLLFATLTLLYWYYGKKLIARRRAMRSFEASPFREETITIEADEQGLKIRSHAGVAQWRWEEIDAVTALGDAALIYKAPHAHYIPSGGFTSIEEKSRFKTLAKAHRKLV